MDPVNLAWESAGSPLPEDLADVGRCARCLAETALVPAAQVVSNKFTGRPDWADPHGHGLCPACTWAYRTLELRRRPMLVDSREHLATQLEPGDLYQLLAAGPLPQHLAIALPLGGRKHVLPQATWGRICADGALIPWSREDSGRLVVVADLRAAGVPATKLAHDAPPWSVARSMPPGEIAALLERWQAVEPWRRRKLWLDVAVAVTHPASTGPSR